MFKAAGSLCLVFAALFSHAVHAEPIPVDVQLIDFEALVDGDQVGETEGVSFADFVAASAGITLNEFEVPPRSGLNVAMNGAPDASIHFSAGMKYVSGFLTYAAPIDIFAYGANGLLLSRTTKFASNLALSGEAGSAPNERFEFHSNEAIVYLTFASSSPATFALDDLLFSEDGVPIPNPVPEPGSWTVILLGLGLLVCRGMRVRLQRLPTKALVAGMIAAGGAHAQAPVAELSVYPQNVRPAVPTHVTATVFIPDSSYIAGSATLNELDEGNKIIKRLAVFVDSGAAGDEVAGDKVYTARFSVNEASARQMRIAASLAFTGTLTRSMSPPFTLWIANDADPSKGAALVQNGKVVFKDASGKTLSSMLLAKYAAAPVTLPIGPATETRTDTAFAAESQQRIGIVTSRVLNVAGEDEGADAPSVFRYFDAAGKLLFTRTSSPGRTYLLDSQLDYVSRSGARLILVEVEDDGLKPAIAYLDDTGALIAQYSTLPGVESIREAMLSSSGRYIGVMGYGSSPRGPQVLALMIDTANGAITQRSYDEATAPSMTMAENLAGTFSIIAGNAIEEQLP